MLRTSDTVTEGSIGPPEPISLLLEGRLGKGRGKGTLSWHLVFDTKTGGRCSWSARRVG